MYSNAKCDMPLPPLCWTSPDKKVFNSCCNSRRILRRVSSRLTVQLWPVGAGQTPVHTGTQNIRTQLSSEIFAHANFFPGTFIQPLTQDRGGSSLYDCQAGMARKIRISSR